MTEAAKQSAAAASKFPEDHKLKERTASATTAVSAAAASAASSTAALDSKYKISAQASAAAASGWNSFKSTVDKNKSIPAAKDGGRQ